mmetsp:Transcript_86763/g.163628  ORF Transcript_86763/g.163628 Transcript_86763/m.163628 type:complete len:258 (-) Transcript_86763:18-791(-)
MVRALSSTTISTVLLAHLLGTLAEDTTRYTFFVENLESGKPGKFTVEVYPEWAPQAAQRFRELVENNFFDSSRFFRVIPGFLAQFGIPGDPSLASEWCDKTIPDDPKKVENSRGTLSFYTDGEGTRSTQLVISKKDNSFLDERGYVPFGKVVEGMFIVDRLYDRYGSGPFKPERIKKEGNAWLEKDFPKLSYISTVVETPVAPPIPEYQGISIDFSALPTSMLIDGLAICLIIVSLGCSWIMWGKGSKPKKKPVLPR